MTQELPVDPELRELLEKVASDERAKLFRTEIPRPTRLVLTDVPHVSLRAAGLTSAEREILRVYREDVAKLLRDAAEWKIQQDPLGAARTSVYSTPTRRDHYADAHELLASLEARTDRVERFSIPNTVAHVARTGRSLLASRNASAHQLAGLSLRLVPHDAAWIHIGRSLALENELRSAARAFVDVVRRRQTPHLAVSSLTCVGAMLGTVGRHEESARVYRTAATLQDPDPNTLLSWLAGSLIAGNAPWALEASAWIETRMSPDAPALLSWVARLAQRLQLNPKAPASDPARAVMRGVLSRVGPSARMVIHELS